MGMLQLGGWAIYFSPEDLQLSRGETVEDTGKVLSRYLDCIMIRTYDHQDVIDLADHATIPVINGLTDFNHPCQALADIMTLREKFGELAGRKLAYVGDGNNMAVSLAWACLKFGMHVSIVSPKNYQMDPGVIKPIEAFAREQNLSFTATDDIAQGVEGADVVYTDVWASMGQEAEQEKRMTDLKDFTVDSAMMAKAKSTAVFMHCLPAHRGEEVTAEVIDGPQSIVFDQAENRLHLQKAILVRVIQ